MSDVECGDVEYDVVVIGAGSAGVRFARVAAKLGARVAIAEERYLGGTCVNVGCVPKKLFVYGAQFSSQFAKAEAYGWQVSSDAVDWPRLRDNKSREIERLNGIYERLLQDSGVTLLNGHARFIDQYQLDVGGQSVKARRIVIATGGWPTLPDIPGKEHFITSNEFFYLDRLPKQAVILGGGYIAVEFAGILNGLGVETTLLYRGPMFLRGFDDDLRHALAEAMRDKGVDIRFNTNIESISADEQGVKQLTLSDGNLMKTEMVLAATGRHPKLDNLGLDEVGVALDERGYINVDDFFQTSVPSIFALGDIVGQVALTPVALRQAMVLAENLFGSGKAVSERSQWRKVDYQCIPTAIFSLPGLATVGYSEAEARKRFESIRVYKSVFTPLKQTLFNADAEVGLNAGAKKEQNVMKLLVDERSDRVVGLHMMGDDVAEIVQGFAVAMKMGATKADFDATVGVHPSAAEELVTFR